VVRNVCDKLIRRHPHVFDTATVEDADGVVKQWGQIKKQEKKKEEYARQSALDGIPSQLPALSKATQIQRKAAQLGFDWPNVSGVLDKIEEEIAELREAIEAGDQNAVQDEIGDLFFAMVNLSRYQKVDAEEALRGTCRKFDRRFRHIESRVDEAEKSFEDYTLDELEAFWVEAKTMERS
jgi:MazG family protein